MKDAADTKTANLKFSKAVRPVGRPTLGVDAMTPAEKQRRYRENRVARLRDAAKSPAEASDAQLVDLIRYNLGVASAAAKAKLRTAALELVKRYK